MAKDALGDRMKGQYESRSQTHLPRRTYTLIRLDGKAFHTYTRGCDRPFDLALMEDMDLTAKALCEATQGCKLAFVQSDEISLALTDFDQRETQAYFDGNVQKITSITASIATAHFNQLRKQRALQVIPGARGLGRASADFAAIVHEQTQLAYFDSRAFVIPDYEEVLNYFVWRQQDATRNSILMAGQAQFSHRELERVNTKEIQERLFQEKGINWNDYPVGFKRGRVVVRREIEGPMSYVNPKGETIHVENVKRHAWAIEEPPIFSQDRAWFEPILPRLNGAPPGGEPGEPGA